MFHQNGNNVFINGWPVVTTHQKISAGNCFASHSLREFETLLTNSKILPFYFRSTHFVSPLNVIKIFITTIHKSIGKKKLKVQIAYIICEHHLLIMLRTLALLFLRILTAHVHLHGTSCMRAHAK